MPRNPAPTKQKKKPVPGPKKEPLELGEERGVPKVAEPLVQPGIETELVGGKILDIGIPPKPIEEKPPAPPVQVIERRIETVTVEIPLGEPPHRFQNIHIGGNEFLLYGEHAQTWARLRQALRDKDARTADGKEVRSGPDILRWLLEQFHSES